MNRRNFMHISALGAGTSLFAGTSAIAAAKSKTLESQLEHMTSRVADVVLISLEEREARIATSDRTWHRHGWA